MIELYNALKLITMLFSIQKILTLNLGVAFLKSVSIVFNAPVFATDWLLVYDGLLSYRNRIGTSFLT